MILATCLALAACAGDEAPPTGSVAVDLSVDDSGLRITKVYPVEQFPFIRAHSPRHLAYRLEDDSGKVIVSGLIDDFRYARSESLADGTLERLDVELGFGAGSLRLPARAGTLILRETAPTGVEVGRTSFDPSAPGMVRQPLLSDGDILGDAVRFAGALDKEAAVDILFLPEGYTEEQLEDFHRDAEESMAAFLALDHFSDYADRFNAYHQDIRSKETGIDDPAAGIAIDTAFDASFGAGDLRRCVFPQPDGFNKAVELREAADADVVVIIANTEEYGGCASNGIFAVTRDPNVAEVIAHELGHAMLQLADEYGGAACDSPPEPGAFNVTAAHDAFSVPWADLVTPGIAFPTPPGTAGVGAFEGGHYCDNGLYRPSDSCLMRTLGTPMCPVCARWRDRFFQGFGLESGPQQDCPPSWRDDDICDLCLGDDPACEPDVCDGDDTCDTVDGEDCATCPGDCGACTEIIECSWFESIKCAIGLDCTCKDVGGGCGDGVCQGSESDENCGQDCGCASLGQCDATSIAPFGCFCDPGCEENGDCCEDIDVCGF